MATRDDVTGRLFVFVPFAACNKTMINVNTQRDIRALKPTVAIRMMNAVVVITMTMTMKTMMILLYVHTSVP